jgi:hypothetical protein
MLALTSAVAEARLRNAAAWLPRVFPSSWPSVMVALELMDAQYMTGNIDWQGAILTRRRSFQERGYVHLPDIITEPIRSQLYTYALNIAATGGMQTEDWVPNAVGAYGTPMMEELLLQLLPRVEQEAGLALYPTYTYFRIYQRGSILERHKDRESCEISLTICLGYKAAAPWPFWIEHNGGNTCIQMLPGQGTLYRGSDYFHWRELFTGDLTAQAFLHYVNRNGPYSSFKFDKRQGLTLPR